MKIIFREKIYNLFNKYNVLEFKNDRQSITIDLMSLRKQLNCDFLTIYIMQYPELNIENIDQNKLYTSMVIDGVDKILEIAHFDSTQNTFLVNTMKKYFPSKKYDKIGSQSMNLVNYDALINLYQKERLLQVEEKHYVLEILVLRRAAMDELINKIRKTEESSLVYIWE